jgi:hypothetical protein
MCARHSEINRISLRRILLHLLQEAGGGGDYVPVGFVFESRQTLLVENRYNDCVIY